MSERTLKRRLNDYGCARRSDVDDDLRRLVRDLILLEIGNGPDSLNGYRTMWHILRLRHGINVPRNLVQRILKEVDPQGVERRKRRCLKRRMYISQGPNHCWHIDGYDKLKPFGFSIHGCVDGFSRRIIWLEVQRSNKNPRAVAKYFLKCVKASRGCPTRVYTDPGTENGVIAGIQCYLRAEGTDEYAALRHINMSQALATKELSVNGPILENSMLVGGVTFFMIFMSQIFLISAVKYTWKHYGIVLLIYCRLTWIRLRNIETPIALESQGMVVHLVYLI